MKYTTYIIIAIIIVIFAGIIFYSYRIVIPWSLYIIIIFFLIAAFILLWFFSREKIPFVRGNKSESLQIMSIIKDVINKNAKLNFRLVDMIGFAEKYFEGNNTEYKAFLFSTTPAGDRIIVWNTKKSDISCMQKPVHIEQATNLFYGFDPFQAKFTTIPQQPSKAYVPLEMRPTEEKPHGGEIIDETS